MGDVVQAGLSARQAAQVLGVSLATVCHWSDIGYLESFLSEHGERRFSQGQIDHFIFMLKRQHVDARIEGQSGAPPQQLHTSRKRGAGGGGAAA